MTTLGDRPAVDDTPAVYTIGEPRLLGAAPDTVPARDHGWLVDAAAEVHLLGRGGSAFPVATKLSALRTRGRVLANGSEGEPASWKDRVLMRGNPDLVVAGVALVARALRSPETVIAVADRESADALAAAVGRSGADIEVRLHDAGFVGGEIGALVNGMNGRTPVPDGVRVLPHVRGLHHRPTYASNVETFAQLALLAALGPAEYAAVGTDGEPGTSLVTVHGTARDGVLEVPHGLGIHRLVREHQGPVLVGGYHGAWTSRSDLVVDRVALREHGLGLGAGVLAVLPPDTCPLGEVARVAAWLAAQSAGQCGPCTFGLPALADDLARLAAGEQVDRDRLRRRIGWTTDRGACHHPSGATRFIGSALKEFGDDVRRHLSDGHCGRPTLGALPLRGSA
jgi:NADH:ubiquinone oxidoreductase subunit F (NADH-binding)